VVSQASTPLVTDEQIRVAPRVSIEVQARFRGLCRLAQVLEPESRITQADVLNRACVNLGVQLRREARKRGLDVEAILADLAPKKGKTTGPPEAARKLL
jgi:hypothetical protein